MKKTNKFTAIFKSAGSLVWFIVSIFLIILFTVLTILEYGLLESILTTVLGGQTPIYGEDTLEIYTSDYSSKEAATEAGDELNVTISEEGFVLLLNEETDGEAALPMAGTEKVSVFGKNSVDLVYGGSGSGGGDSSSATTLYEALEDSGFDVNPTLKEFYESNASGSGRSDNPELSDSSSSAPTLDIGETPVNSYTSEVRSSFSEYGDAAIVVLSRVGGESFDLPRFQNTENGGIAGNHYLQLDENEYDMLDLVTSRFDKVIVLLNTLNTLQCDFIDEYNNTPDDPRIDAVMWIGGPGTTGIEAIGPLLTGEANPSGRTVDIYARDYTAAPTWQNFGDGSQTTDDGSGNTAFLENGDDVSGYNMVSYEEGIYMGYRYYETRAYEELQEDSASEWYEENVVFPFGYGLSYTEFDQEITSVNGSLEGTDGEITVTVEVTNTGSVAGKDVVELYVSKPYTEGGIEKSYVELVDYDKTVLLDAGETDTVSFTVESYDLASYDYNDANANDFMGYELEQGDYTFYISANSHVTDYAYDSETVTLADSVTFAEDTTTGYTVENLYTTDDYYDIQYRLSDVDVEGETRKGMSRTDFEGTFPTAPTSAERELDAETDSNGLSEKEALTNMEHNNPVIEEVTEMPTTGASTDLTLRDLLDDNGKADYDDERWDEILDSLSFSTMLDLVNNGAFQTIAIESIGKNLTNDSDGPIGFVNFMPGLSSTYVNNTIFACESIIGATWNKDLAYQMGQIVGEDGLWGDTTGTSLPYSGWYAPAINLHRSPFSGRNFEYYSEDPVLTGKTAVNVINGAATKGVYTDLKHFALNDQETNRAGVSTFCTEQALRELYLKPFEIAVKADDDATQVPSAVEDGVNSYSGTMGVMSSFNRIGNRWTGGDYKLMTEILRNEWGFRGLVICDYKTDNTFMNSRQMLYAGNDLILASLSNLMWTDASSSSAQDVAILRQSTKNILYTTTNSNAIQADIVGYSTEWWKTLTIVLDCVVPVAIVVWGFFAIRKAWRKADGKEEPKKKKK